MTADVRNLSERSTPPHHLTLLAELASPKTAWMRDALCAEVGGDFWFQDPGKNAHKARGVCGYCPVRTACLQYALERDEAGIWGGLTRQQRRRLKRGKQAAA